MKYLTVFEKFKQNNDILIIVDVQKSFKKYFNDKYLSELNDHAENFSKVYQIFDNHHEGKSVDKDYLYDENPNLDNVYDLYSFPHQSEIIEKRYNYDVDADFYKKILDERTFNEIKSREGQIKQGEYFPTSEGTIIVFIGNNHQWFHVPKKLYEVFQNLKQAQSENLRIEIVGGAMGECLEDITTTAKSLGLRIDKNPKFIYSANFCPIK